MIKKRTLKDEHFSVARWRFALLGLLLCALLCLLVFHLASLQVMPGKDKGFEFLQGQGNARTLRVEPLSASRGVITDRHGEPLAVSTPVVSLWANPGELLADSPDVAPLSKALGLSESKLRAKLTRAKHREFIYLKRHLAPQQAEQILLQRWAGVYGRSEYKRYYPAGEVAAHIVGFTDIDDLGQEGLELAFDDWLSGMSGERQVLKDLKGRIVKDVGLLQAPEAGKDLRLSIDLRIQYLAYRELKQAVAQHGAKGGSIVLLDARTGEVLAMANQPAYNPNDRRRLNVASLRNRAIIDQFEPGSTMKPLSMLAAMETGRYHPRTQIDTSPGYLRVGKKTLHDPINYGRLNLTRIMTKSSQIGVTKIALDMEPNQIRDIYERVGLGQGTGIGFPGESVGLLPNKTHWTDIERANFAFGHGLSTTALQLAQAYAVIASRGEKRDVSLLYQASPPEAERVIDHDISEQMVQMLKTVAGPEGTAKRAQIKAYPVAGKTGTIHKVGKQGYAADRYQAVFAGMAPADDPRVVAVVIVDEPSTGKYFGGLVAAPIFSVVAEAALRLMHVPPKVETDAPAQLAAVSRRPLS